MVGAGLYDPARARRGDRRVGGSAPHPRGLRAAVGRQADGQLAPLSMDERVRGGWLCRQRMVARRTAVDDLERRLDADRGNSLMADRAEIIDLSHVIEEGMVTY